MRSAITIVCGWTVLAALPARAADDPAELAHQVDRAVAAAVQYLWQRHRGDGWDEHVPGAQAREHGGRTALCLYALLAAGQSWQEERMERTIRHLAQIEPNGVYARSFRACAFALLPPRLREPVLSRDLRYLLEAQRPDGAYDYEPSSASDDRWDNSNTQIAVLGVWSAAEAGLDVPAQFWRRAEQHWLRTQTADGGWSYTHARGRSYGSMTAGALASLLACFDAIHAERFTGCQAQPPSRPIERALEWMEANFDAFENPGKGPQHFHYYLYAVERAGLASGYKYFGRHDWYVQGARELLRTQGDDGGWGNEVDTAFALLFLARGRHPVLFNKLRYEGTWNTRPRDLANLTGWISRTLERTVYWQVLDVDAPQEQWYEAPVLYISGATAPRFTDEHLAKIRHFVQRGGMILSEAACNSPAFTMEMQRVYAKLFPDYPLKRLGEDHPVYRLQFHLESPLPLEGVSNGVRLLAVHSPTDLSRAWQINAVLAQQDRFEQAANLYLYATGGQTLRRHLAIQWPREQPAPASATLPLAVLRHEGNWQSESLAYQRLAILLRNACGLELAPEPVAPAELSRRRFGVAVISGTDDFTLSPQDRQALRAFLLSGGMLIAHAAGGSEAFDAALRRELFRGVLPEAYVGRLAQQSELYRPPDRPADRIDRVSFNRAARVGYSSDPTPRLEAAVLGTRVAVLYSRLDLTAGLLGLDAAHMQGYAPSGAFALMRNCLLFAQRHAPPLPQEPVIEIRWSAPPP